MELIVQAGPDTGKVFQIGPNPQVAGRQSTTDIVLNDNQISRRHAQFELINGTLVVNDLGSANGTRVNGETLPSNTPRQLRPGDQVQLGDTVLAVGGVPTSQEATEVINVPRQPAAAPASAEPAAAPAADDYVPGASWQSSAPSAPPPAANPAPFNTPPPQQQAAPPVMPGAAFNAGPGMQPAPTDYVPGAYAPQPVAQFNAPRPPKKGGSPVGWIIGVVVLLLAAVGAFLVLGNESKPQPTQNGVFVPATNAPGAPTPAPAGPTATPAKGVAGANAAPAKPVPTTAAARRPTATPAPTSSSSANGQNITGIGLAMTFPEDWEIFTDESKKLIEGSAPDKITYVQAQLLSGFRGSGVDRLSTYITNIKKSQADIKVVREAKALSSGNGAEVYITYIDKEDKLLHRDYVIAVPSSNGGDTYILRCSTDDAKFDVQVATFNRILSSIKDS